MKEARTTAGLFHFQRLLQTRIWPNSSRAYQLPCRLRSSVSAGLARSDIRVVLFGLWNREVHVSAVTAALVPGSGGEHRLRRAPVVLDQPAHVAHPMAGGEERERTLPEQQVHASRLCSGVGQIAGESCHAALGACLIQLLDEQRKVRRP